MNTKTELLSTQVAAERLHELLPERTAKQWSQWLQNNRNQNRPVAYRIPFERISNGAFYRPDDLRAFADHESRRRIGNRTLSPREQSVLQAFGIGEPNGSSTGRKLVLGGINPQVDDATKKHFIQFIINDPLLVFRLELDQAQELINELQEAVDYCQGTWKHKSATRTVVIE